MIVGTLIVAAVGILCTVMGYLLWKKERITLLHDYHYAGVAEKDKKAFCALSGIGVLSIGLGLLLTAVVWALTESAWSFLAFAVGLVVGIALLLAEGKRYNTK